MSAARSEWTGRDLRGLQERGRVFSEVFPGGKGRGAAGSRTPNDDVDGAPRLTRREPTLRPGPPSTDEGTVGRLARIVRDCADATVAGLGLAVAVLLVGMPIALAARLVHDLAGWVNDGKTNATLVTGFASLAWIVGGVCLIVLFIAVAIGLVRFVQVKQRSRPKRAGANGVREHPSRYPITSEAA